MTCLKSYRLLIIFNHAATPLGALFAQNYLILFDYARYLITKVVNRFFLEAACLEESKGQR
jgi:hypothetical protein